MKMITTVFVVIAFASSVLGECPVPPTVPGADSSKLTGRWYAMAGPLAGEAKDELNCMTIDFVTREDGDFNFTIMGVKSDHSKYENTDLAKRTDDQNLLNIWPISYEAPMPTSFFIADTDYDHYLAAYTCLIVPPRSAMDLGLILSRTNIMSDEKLAELTDLLVKKVGFPSDYFGPIIQKDCEYWPVLQ